MPRFTPPTYKMPIGPGPLFNRFSYDKGISVVKINGIYIQVPYPSADVTNPMTDGVDYFMGGHGPYEVSDELAAELVAAGFTVEGDLPDPVPLPGGVRIATGQMPSRTTATITWDAPTEPSGQIGGFYVRRNGALVGIYGPADRTHSEGGLPTDIPEIEFTYEVVAFNEEGEGAALNTLKLQWKTVVTPPVDPDPDPEPTDPPGFGEGGFGAGRFGDDDTAPPSDPNDTFGAGPYGDGPFGD